MQTRYRDEVDGTHALVGAIGAGTEHIGDVGIDGIVTVTEMDWRVGLYADEWATGSDKTVTVPGAQLWHILWAWGELTTDAAVAARQIEVQILDPEGDTILEVRAGTTQAASLTYHYAFAPALADLTAVRDTTYLMTPFPPTVLLPPGFQLRMYDNTATGGGDNLNLQVQYAYRSV